MSEELEQRFLYTVKPKRVIRNLNESIPIIATTKSLYLTKEEVLKCFDYGTVYRRFSNINLLEMINKYDVDRVHRDKYISKEDWKKIQEKAKDVTKLDVNGNSVEPTVEEKVIAVELKEELEKVAETTKTNFEEEKTEELPVVTSGYIEEVKDKPEELPEVTTTTNVPEDTTITIELSENADLEEEINDIVDTIEELSENTESDEDEVIEKENIEASEQESKNENRVVVNYSGKKKKHKH